MTNYKTSFIDAFKIDNLLVLFKFLDTKDIVSLAQTCNALKWEIDINQQYHNYKMEWKKMFHEDVPRAINRYHRWIMHYRIWWFRGGWNGMEFLQNFHNRATELLKNLIQNVLPTEEKLMFIRMIRKRQEALLYDIQLETVIKRRCRLLRTLNIALQVNHGQELKQHQLDLLTLRNSISNLTWISLHLREITDMIHILCSKPVLQYILSTRPRIQGYDSKRQIDEQDYCNILAKAMEDLDFPLHRQGPQHDNVCSYDALQFKNMIAQYETIRRNGRTDAYIRNQMNEKAKWSGPPKSLGLIKVPTSYQPSRKCPKKKARKCPKKKLLIKLSG